VVLTGSSRRWRASQKSGGGVEGGRDGTNEEEGHGVDAVKRTQDKVGGRTQGRWCAEEAGRWRRRCAEEAR
jgi:hypothetical protein